MWERGTSDRTDNVCCVMSRKHSCMPTPPRSRCPSLPGLLGDSVTCHQGAVAPAQANESDSSTTERRARAATRWLHGRDRQHRTQPGGEVSDQFGFVSEDGQFRERSALERNKVQRKISGVNESCPCSRLLAGGACTHRAGRSLAAYCPSSATGGASRRIAVSCPCEASRAIAGPGRAKPRDHWCLAFQGAHELF